MRNWLLNHERRSTWMLLELMRPLPWRLRFANCWWQARHYSSRDAWQMLWETWDRSQPRIHEVVPLPEEAE